MYVPENADVRNTLYIHGGCNNLFRALSLFHIVTLNGLVRKSEFGMQSNT